MIGKEYREISFSEDTQLYAQVINDIDPQNFCHNLIKIQTSAPRREVLINILEIESVELPRENSPDNNITICLASGKEYIISLQEAERFLSLISYWNYYASTHLKKYKEQGS